MIEIVVLNMTIIFETTLGAMDDIRGHLKAGVDISDCLRVV